MVNDMSKFLNKKNINFFNENGYVVFKSLFSKKKIESIYLETKNCQIIVMIQV